MRILIYGAGAIGGYLGAVLSEAGLDVSLLARGATHAALAAGGIVLEQANGRRRRVPLRVLHADEVDGGYDLVLVTLKATQLAAAAPHIAATAGPDASIVMIQNGLPWWYFEQIDSPLHGTRLHSLDPDGALARGFELERVVGAVIYQPVTVRAPGHLLTPGTAPARLIIGEIDNRIRPRTERITDLLGTEGLEVSATSDIRREKWRKLLINLVWNPLCALTQSAPGHIAALPGGARLVGQLLQEATTVAAALSVQLDCDPERELQRVAGNFDQQPSMLQDLRAGRALETDAILNSVIEIADLVGVAVPTLRNIASCIALLDQRLREDAVAIRPIPLSHPEPSRCSP
ncbi:MAG TPA: 2-dehydropantoate 2-reductase [Noviherbaspirillum sp.]